MPTKIDQTAIRNVLLRDWDPTWVKDVPAVRNEYDGYIAPIAEMLASGKPIQDIGAYLCCVESERMGLAADPRRAGAVALKLKAIALLQPDFRISDAARDRILALTRQCRDEKHVEVVPCLSMMLQRDNAWLSESVPVVGFYEQNEVGRGDIATVDGLAFVLAVGHEGAVAFAGKTLVYDEGGFRLI